MTTESPQAKPEVADDEDAPQNPERVATGPLADEEPGEPSIDLEALFQELEAKRDQNERVNVAAEREAIGGRREEVTRRIEKEKQRDSALAATRQELGVPHEAGDTLERLEEAKESLEEREQQIGLAGEYNDALASFGDLSREEVEHIAKTGSMKDGTRVQSHGKEIRSEAAQTLARMHLDGRAHVTWGELNTLCRVADTVIKDILIDPVKGIFRGTRHEKRGMSDRE